MNKAKVLGVIASLVGAKILFSAFSGQPANSTMLLSNWIGGAEGTAIVLSIILGLIGVGFGLRALIWNKVCIGETCEIDVKEGK